MSKKFKIEVSTGNTVEDVAVFVDDVKIGLVQDVKCKASVQSPFVEVVLVFPDFTDLDALCQKSVTKSVKLLEEFSNIKVFYKKLF